MRELLEAEVVCNRLDGFTGANPLASGVHPVGSEPLARAALVMGCEVPLQRSERDIAQGGKFSGVEFCLVRQLLPGGLVP